MQIVLFYIDREQWSVESFCFWERGLHWWLVWCSSSETLGRLDLAGHGFSMCSKMPLKCLLVHHQPWCCF